MAKKVRHSDAKFSLRLSEKELETIREAARQCQMAVGKFIRIAASKAAIAVVNR